MKTQSRWHSAFISALVFALLGLIWVVFAPVKFGGQAAYVLVNGNSMEPDFHRGDMVLVRRAPEYRVGDAVAYQSGDLGQVVFHRIVDQNQDRFMMKGDNNAWLDNYQPTYQEVLGKLWAHFPEAGGFVQKLRSPGVLAFFAAIIGVMLMNLNSKSTLEESSHQRIRFRFPEISVRGLSQGAEVSVFILAIIFFVALFLGIFAFTRPVQRYTADNYEYVQMGSYEYRAAAPEGIYDTQGDLSGEPVFLKLSQEVELRFFYNFVTDLPHDAIGNYSIQAELSDISGLKRTIPLVPATAFEGDHFTASATLNLPQIRSLIEKVEEQTGLNRAQYTLTVLPTVNILGGIQGRMVEETFSPPLKFYIDEIMLQVVGNSEEDPFNPVQPGVAAGTKLVPATLSIFGMELPVSTARALSGGGLALSVLGAVALYLLVNRVTNGEETALIELKYAPLLADVTTSDLMTGGNVIDVSAIDDLVRLAERHGATILHESLGNMHSYYLNHDSHVYRYQMSTNEMVQRGGSLTFWKSELQLALEREEFEVYYQPVFSLNSNKPIMVEALLRWRHPERGLISPAEFLPAAEDTGMIIPIGEWVLKTTCTQLKSWRELGLPPISLALNLSISQLQRKNLGHLISSNLEEAGLSPDDIRFEFSAGKVVDGIDQVSPMLAELQKLGVQVWMDDFESNISLNLLTNLPVTGLKFDGGFSRRAIEGSNDGAVAHALIDLAHSMNMRVVAEGIEELDQADFFRAQNCDEGQGFLFGRPMGCEELEKLLFESKEVL